MMDWCFVGSIFGCSLVANLTKKFVFVSFDVKISWVYHLTSILLNFVVVVRKSFENNDKIARELCNEHVEKSFTLYFPLLSQIVLHKICYIDVIFYFIENSSFLKLKSNHTERFCFYFCWNWLVLSWVFNSFYVWCFDCSLEKRLGVEFLLLFFQTTSDVIKKPDEKIGWVAFLANFVDFIWSISYLLHDLVRTDAAFKLLGIP